MNRLPGRIVDVDCADGITLVDVESAGVQLTALLVGAARRLAPGDAVELAFQEAEVALARDLAGAISLRNCLPCRVTGLERGRLLTRVSLEFAGHPLESIITTRSAERLALAVGVAVEALIKANEMSLA